MFHVFCRGLAAAVVVLTLTAGPASAGRFIFDEENDSIGKFGDRHFTQGIRLGYLSDRIAGDSGWNSPYAWLSSISPIFDTRPGQDRRMEITIGQSMFTPANLRLINPDPTDRPYAGWLYSGVSLFQQRGQMLETFNVELGVVGPAALTHQAQDLVHDLLKDREANGWAYQLRNEPGLVASYERRWRFEKPLGGGFGFDLIPAAGPAIGNVLSYGEAGATVRLGQNMAVDYGPGHIQPGRGGADWFDDSAIGPRSFGWYLYAGARGRVVARNIFLDGNTFTRSRSVDKKVFVADITGGAALYWSHRIKLDVAFTQRSREYASQPRPDRFGAVTISFGL